MFEKLGEKIANLGGAVQDKTADIIDNTKKGVETFSQKNKIDRANKDINDVYCEMGRKLYEGGKESAPEGYDGYFIRVDELKKLIADTEAEIRELNGIVVCPSCGANNKKDTIFCVNCGYKIKNDNPVDKANDSDEIACTSCGKLISAKSAFCPFCGNKVVKAEEKTVEEEPVKEPTCPQCGEKVNPDAAFCTHCGQRLK